MRFIEFLEVMRNGSIADDVPSSVSYENPGAMPQYSYKDLPPTPKKKKKKNKYIPLNNPLYNYS